MKNVLLNREEFLSKKINLDKIRCRLEEELKQTSLDDDDIYRMQLAVDEACSNIIIHNYHEAQDKPIFITVYEYKDKISVIIQDNGDKYNPLNIADPNLQEHIREYRKQGLGVFLMRKLVDELIYHASNKKGNTIELIKYTGVEELI